jgi:hypothetical protein
MYYETDQRRFVLVLGESAERLIDDPKVRILERRNGVVLVETSYWTAAQIRHRGDVTTHCYEREGAARQVFGLFDDPSRAPRDPG